VKEDFGQRKRASTRREGGAGNLSCEKKELNRFTLLQASLLLSSVYGSDLKRIGH
jgi:hypothetical protein